MIRVKNMHTANGKVSYFDIKKNEKEETVVFVGGFGCPSTICEFDKVFKQLDYNIIGIDYLGTGISEITKAERTFKNIVYEIESVIKEINSNALYLCGFSSGGAYLYSLIEKYPEKIKAFIGIEPTIPNLKVRFSGKESGDGGQIFRYFNTLGFKEKELFLKRKMIIDQIDPELYKYYYQPETIFNENYFDELKRTEENYKEIVAKTTKHPILLFCTDNNKEQFKKTIYDNEVKESKLVVINCSHRIHRDESYKVSVEINDFIRNITNGEQDT